MKNSARLFLLVAVTAMPATALAGAYGNSAVKDANVANGGAAGNTIWCQRIEADVPERLAAQMDCGGGAVAGVGITRPRQERTLASSDDGVNTTNDDSDGRNRPLPSGPVASSNPPGGDGSGGGSGGDGSGGGSGGDGSGGGSGGDGSGGGSGGGDPKGDGKNGGGSKNPGSNKNDPKGDGSKTTGKGKSGQTSGKSKASPSKNKSVSN